MWSPWKWLNSTVSTWPASKPAARKLVIQVPLVGAPRSPLPVSISTSLPPVLMTSVVKVIGKRSVGRKLSASACCTAPGGAFGMKPSSAR